MATEFEIRAKLLAVIAKDVGTETLRNMQTSGLSLGRILTELDGYLQAEIHAKLMATQIERVAEAIVH